MYLCVSVRVCGLRKQQQGGSALLCPRPLSVPAPLRALPAQVKQLRVLECVGAVGDSCCGTNMEVGLLLFLL